LIFKTIIMMYSIGNILVTIAAPTTNDASITQYEPNDAVPDNTTAAFTPDDANDDDVNLSIGDVLGPLEGTALKCCSRAGREKLHSQRLLRCCVVHGQQKKEDMQDEGETWQEAFWMRELPVPCGWVLGA
jgi:hypothetical protein